MDLDLPAPAAVDIADLDLHRGELRGYCYRMLGSVFEADDAVQETIVRAWKAADRFEGRSSVRSWLYRIATNVCLDHLASRNRRARPMDLHPSASVDSALSFRPAEAWIEPFPNHELDPAVQAAERDSVRLAFIAALQLLPPRQRAVLILCEVLDWRAAEAAELLGSTVASVNSALQRARATLAEVTHDDAPGAPIDQLQHDLLDRYVRAFEAYDIDALTSLIHEDARQSMPPIEQWLEGRGRILGFWQGPGAECRGSRLVVTQGANGLPAFAQYRKHPSGGYRAWALQVLHVVDGRIAEFSMFLDVERLFPRFGLGLELDEDGAPR